MTLNKMMIIGNLGADPELRYTPSGKAVTNLRVAVNHNFRGADGEWQKETQWFNVEVWDQAAERAAEQLRKGNKVYAEGRLRTREWEGQDGQKRTSVEIRADRVLSLERREPGGEGFSGGGGMTDVPMETGGATAARPQAAATRPASGEEPFVDVDDIPF
jgi:single-strand DNA-binding protein